MEVARDLSSIQAKKKVAALENNQESDLCCIQKTHIYISDAN
jgi:hypothetical protein